MTAKQGWIIAGLLLAHLVAQIADIVTRPRPVTMGQLYNKEMTPEKRIDILRRLPLVRIEGGEIDVGSVQQIYSIVNTVDVRAAR